jgi:hypothetical protein
MRKVAYWLAGILGVVLVAVAIAAFLVDEPLRRSMERQINGRLVGYRATVGKLDFHPIGFSIDLENVTLVQEAHPDPPVAQFPRISASVEWSEIIRGRVVANFRFVRPTLYVDRAHFEREAKDDVPVDKRGWQDALAAIYPLKINTFIVVDGDVTYVDAKTREVTTRPLRLRPVNFTARNIRNIQSPDRVYPSEVHLDTGVFDTGRLVLDGRADFLAEPHIGIKADVTLEQVPLAAFEPVARRAHLSIRKGVLGAAGTIEYAPQVKIVHLRDLALDGFDGDWVHTPRAKATEQKVAQTTRDAAEQAANHPTTLLRADLIRVRRGTFGFVNRAATPDYRVFLANTDLEIRNFSNQRTEGTSTAKLSGQFMGSGRTIVSATFRPEVNGPDFDVNVKVEDTDMRAMNDLFRAYGKFDVVGGLFSFYSELKVKDRAVNGYVKPLFKNVDAYDRRQDAEKTAFRKLYERVVEGVSKLLENRRRDEVATKADVSGPLENPRTSTWQVIANLIENAFFQAILPGFEREIRGRPAPAVTGRNGSRSGRS